MADTTDRRALAKVLHCDPDKVLEAADALVRDVSDKAERINRLEAELARLKAGFESLADRAFYPTELNRDTKVIPRWMLYELRDGKNR